MGELSVIQVVMVLVIALLVFGPSRLPELGRQLGRGLNELRRHASSMTEELGRVGDDDGPAAARPTPAPAAPSDNPLADVLVPRSSASGSTPPQSAADGDDDILSGVVVAGDSTGSVTDRT